MNIHDIIKVIEQQKSSLGITLYPPANESEIEHLESSLQITLPTDIKTFYKSCNGFESDEDIFRIIPLEESLEYACELKENELYIAEYMTYLDMWAVILNPKNNTYKIFEYSYKTVLTNSFAEFLERFLKGGVFENGGLYDWKEQINNSKN